jgi:hypothetical protein
MGPRFRMGRRRGLVAGAVVGATVANARNKSKATAEDTEQVAGSAPMDTSQQIAELEKLGKLKADGILTQEEFDAKKKEILGL